MAHASWSHALPRNAQAAQAAQAAQTAQNAQASHADPRPPFLALSCLSKSRSPRPIWLPPGIIPRIFFLLIRQAHTPRQYSVFCQHMMTVHTKKPKARVRRSTLRLDSIRPGSTPLSHSLQTCVVRQARSPARQPDAKLPYPAKRSRSARQVLGDPTAPTPAVSFQRIPSAWVRHSPLSLGTIHLGCTRGSKTCPVVASQA